MSDLAWIFCAASVLFFAIVVVSFLWPLIFAANRATDSEHAIRSRQLSDVQRLTGRRPVQIVDTTIRDL